MNTRLIALSFLFTILVCPSAASQAIGGIWENHLRVDGFDSNDEIGLSVSGIADLNGDGIPDLLVGSDSITDPFSNERGAYFAWSGADGSHLYTVFGVAAAEFGNTVAPWIDYNGDGVTDFLASDPGLLAVGYFRGGLFLYSGSDGALLREWAGEPGGAGQFGKGLTVPGDMDGDGLDDFAVSAITLPGASGTIPSAGWIYYWSTAIDDFSHIAEGILEDGELGHSLAPAGDIDGDSKADLLVGSPFMEDPIGDVTGRAHVYSATGVRLFDFIGTEPHAQFGRTVSGGHDLTGDGVPDFLIGAPAADTGTVRGEVHVIDGATQQTVHVFQGSLNHWIGEAILSAGDVDGDGFNDVVLSDEDGHTTGGNPTGYVEVYTSDGWSLVERISPEILGQKFGHAMASGYDFDGDGNPDLISGAIQSSEGGRPNSGSAYIHRFNPILTLDSNEISVSGGPPITFSIDFPASEAGALYAVAASASGTGPTTVGSLDIPLTNDAIFQFTTSGRQSPATTGFLGRLDLDGDGTAQLLVHPGLAGFVGTTFHVASVRLLEPALVPSMVSRASALTVQP